MNPVFYIGLMSGTSLDAIDGVICAFSDDDCMRVVATHSIPLLSSLKNAIVALQPPHAGHIDALGRTDTLLGSVFAECCCQLIEKSNIDPKNIMAIGSPGQTILHSPNGTEPFSIQIGDPHIIATRTGIRTVADFRRRDIALGGQGAPLAPAFHEYYFRTPEQNRIIVNIGGIANLTWLPKNAQDPVIGFDTGPGNTLLDNWCMTHQHQPFDRGGQWAARGVADPRLLATMLSDPYFKKSYPKSTGREYFNLTWVQQNIEKTKKLDTTKMIDIQATLSALTAHTIANAILNITSDPCDIFICGGGAQNDFLMQQLREQLSPYSVASTEIIGLHPQWVEAATFAWLAKQTIEGKPGNIPSVTGACRASILGAIYAA